MENVPNATPPTQIAGGRAVSVTRETPANYEPAHQILKHTILAMQGRQFSSQYIANTASAII